MMPSTPSSFRTLPKAMLKLPMMTPTVLRPLLKIPRELFASLELLDGSVPTGFETGEEGAVFGSVAVIGPELIMGG